LGGLEAVKTFGRQALRSERPENVKPKGLLLLGVPGTGKSAYAKALGNETGRPTLTMDLGSMFGSLVGQTEERMRKALAIADAMSPCVLFVDEIEKGLAGASGSGNLDSGVGQRMFGTFLTWLNDHETDVFLVATSNNISALPPEFSRAERFDAIFFIDFPTPEERKRIWQIHMSRYSIKHQGQRLPDDTDWTGAEIAACCRLSALLGVTLEAASSKIVPISSTAAEKVSSLRTWATGRCLDAHTGEHYESRAQVTNNTKRAIARPGVKV
jgi:SpoVK/Ycf46/Vps4 family AAA+-type ATPase